MATAERPTRYVPIMSPDERVRRNREAMALLKSWATEGDEQEQRRRSGVETIGTI